MANAIRSMTGFGRGRCEVGGRRMTVEIRSVNHRFFELKLRLPWAEPALEQHLGQALRRRLDRGSITVTVRDEGGSEALPMVSADLALGRAYVRALEELRQACGMTEPVTLALVAAQPGVLLVGGAALDPDALWTQLEPGVTLALDALVASRQREGQALAADLRARGAELRRLASEIASYARETPEDLRRRLEERLTRLASSVSVDPQRLAQEVALLADRADIAEEVARLGSHLDEFERQLVQGGAIGRRLEFLAQELHREVNTIGSKSQRLEISQRMIAAKVEVERIREQVQNVE
ncbi:MAG TPA: YicC/YloC family endoribonuclease [Polyangia bacterium]|nr:YicC/YloC family endoribonuclease [Polyangia bacterium]